MKTLFPILLAFLLLSISSHAQISKNRTTNSIDFFTSGVHEVIPLGQNYFGVHINSKFGTRNLMTYSISYGNRQGELDQLSYASNIMYNMEPSETNHYDHRTTLQLYSSRKSLNFGLSMGKRLETGFFEEFSMGFMGRIGAQYNYLFGTQIDYELGMDDSIEPNVADSPETNYAPMPRNSVFQNQLNAFYQQFALNHMANVFGEIQIDINFEKIGFYIKKIGRYHLYNGFETYYYSPYEFRTEMGVRFFY